MQLLAQAAALGSLDQSMTPAQVGMFNEVFVGSLLPAVALNNRTGGGGHNNQFQKVKSSIKAVLLAIEVDDGPLAGQQLEVIEGQLA